MQASSGYDRGFSTAAQSVRVSHAQEEATSQHLSKMLKDIAISDHTTSKAVSIIGQDGSPKNDEQQLPPPFKTPKPFTSNCTVVNDKSSVLFRQPQAFNGKN